MTVVHSQASTTMEFFKTIKWCADILDDPNIAFFDPPCRLKANGADCCPTKDELMRKTLYNAECIPNVVAFYPTHFPPDIRTSELQPGPRFLIESVTLLFDLRSGVNGYNGVAHGGLTATLIDEAMGTLMFQNHEVYKEKTGRNESMPAEVLNMDDLAIYTVSMGIQYQRPITTPQVVMVQATLSHIMGRKLFFKVMITNGDGGTLASGEGMWISVSADHLGTRL